MSEKSTHYNDKAGDPAPGNRPGRSGDVRNHRKGSARHTGRILAIVAAAVLLICLCALAVYANQYTLIFPNIYVGDCNLSGKTATEALSLLNDKYDTEKIQNLTLSLVCQDSKADLPIRDLAVEYQNEASVEAALARSTYPNLWRKTFAMAVHLLCKTKLEPTIGYNKEVLAHTLDTLITPYEIEPVGYTFSIGEDHVTLYGKVNGIKAEREPIIKQVEGQIRDMAFSEISILPANITPEPLDFDEFYDWLTAPPQNAYYEKNSEGKVVVHPGKLQCSVAPETVKAALTAVDKSPDNTAVFPVTTTSPPDTTALLQEQLYKDKLGSYSTYYSGTAARVNNVKLAVSRINGYEMMPGDELSYDKTILPRTYENGYRAAPVYVGNKVESGMGGGICQPSSTLYGAALYANLEILERHNHSMLVSYMPPGLDATIAEGYLDLRLRNNTGYPIKIVADASGGKVTFSIWGYNPENISVDLLRSGGGYSYGVTRIVKKNGDEISREKMPSSQYSPKATETPTETPAPTETTTPDPSATQAAEPSAAPDVTPQPAQTPAPSFVTPTPAPSAPPIDAGLAPSATP